MNRETAEAWALGTIGFGIGIAREAKRELVEGDTREKLETLALVGCIGLLAVSSYGAYKILSEHIEDQS